MNVFTNTEIGQVPTDWVVTKIEDAFQVRNNLRLPISREIRNTMIGPYPYYGPTGIQGYINEYRVSGEFALIGEDGDHFLKWKYAPMTLLVNGKFNVNNHAHIVAGVENEISWFYFYFMHRDITAYLTRQGAGRYKLTKAALLTLPCVIPPRKEQKAIAKALSETDALITAFEKLLEKKRAIKTATMQQLLTGRTRLPGFGEGKGYKDSELGRIPEDWEEYRIRSLTDNIIDYRGVTPKKLGMDWGGGDIVALSAGNVRDGYIDLSADAYYGSIDLYRRWMRNGIAKKNDIVFTMEAPLGNVALIPDDRRYILSQRTILLQLNQELVNSGYFYHFLRSERFKFTLQKRATGSTAQGIQRRKFELLPTIIPPIEEQTAIATILDGIDSELRQLTKKIRKHSEIKTAMMQQLLTGRTRLI